MSTWTNPDGLEVRFGTDRTEAVRGSVEHGSFDRIVINLNSAVPIDGNTVDPMTAAGMDAYKDENTPFIPANSYITRAYFVVTTGFVGTSGTLDIGLMEADGSVVDIDAIDDGINVNVLNAIGDVVVCDGAAVGGVVKTSATLDTYVCFSELAAQPFSAGAGYLVVEYFHAP